MSHRWRWLNSLEYGVYRAISAFLETRLEEKATIDWALKLGRGDKVKRYAILDLVDSTSSKQISEPWKSAWSLIEESWAFPSPTSAWDDDREFTIKVRISNGERSGVLIDSIVKLVAPTLEVKPFSEIYSAPQRRKKKNVSDLFFATLTSGKVVDPYELGIENVIETSFLTSLALSLDAAVSRGLNTARKIGWADDGSWWRLGQLNRVYYVPASARADTLDEPDIYHKGIAASVKLLHAVVAQLASVAPAAAIGFINRWATDSSSVYLRLYASFAQDQRLIQPSCVADLLASVDDDIFWNTYSYPEIAELRAKRFSDLSRESKLMVTKRIKKGPPRTGFLRKADTKEIRKNRLYISTREMRRLQAAGAILSPQDEAWLAAKLIETPESEKPDRIDTGFPESSKAFWVAPNPDGKYNLISGEERLRSLEMALTSERRRWDDDPSERAADWIRQSKATSLLIQDLATIDDGGASFPLVWDRLGWAHSASPQGEEEQKDINFEVSTVLRSLNKLPEEALRLAINGISHWFFTWGKEIVKSPDAYLIWKKIWLIAVENTNATQPLDEQIDLNTVATVSGNSEPKDLDTLNTPVGKLVGVFLTACPSIEPGHNAFSEGSIVRQMRDDIILATHRAGLISVYRMTEHLLYFLNADPEWTKEHLISRLLSQTTESAILWRAVARRTQFGPTMVLIGDAMVVRATDPLLGRESRQSLVFSLVIECLHSFLAQREPLIPYPKIEQMIRSLDDEVRAYGADSIRRFVKDLSGTSPPNSDEVLSPERLFRDAAQPFLEKVWPREHTLVTPGVSRAFADLPAVTGDLFSEAVSAVRHLLVPFQCWSLIDYGLYGEEGESPLLNRVVDTPQKACALLELFNLTIGSSEGATVPHGLSEALEHVRDVAPNLESSQMFRRLATLSRR